MNASTWIALGAFVLAVASAVFNYLTSSRTTTVAEEDLSLRQLQAANAALDHRVTDLEKRLGIAETKVDECEKRDSLHVRQRDMLLAFIIKAGLTPPPGVT